jgi:hypothetical protein
MFVIKSLNCPRANTDHSSINAWAARQAQKSQNESWGDPALSDTRWRWTGVRGRERNALFCAACPMRAAPPAVGCLDILGIGAGGGERVWAGAAIFEQRRFGGAIAPAEQTAIVDRMEWGAAKRKSGGGRNGRRIQTRCRFQKCRQGRPESAMLTIR